MRTALKLIFTFTIILLIVCCGGEKDLFKFNFNFSQPMVVFVDPGNHFTNVDSNTNITIKFSNRMDIMKTTGAFSLSSSSGSIGGFFASNPARRL